MDGGVQLTPEQAGQTMTLIYFALMLAVAILVLENFKA